MINILNLYIFVSRDELILFGVCFYIEYFFYFMSLKNSIKLYKLILFLFWNILSIKYFYKEVILKENFI